MTREGEMDKLRKGLEVKGIGIMKGDKHVPLSEFYKDPKYELREEIAKDVHKTYCRYYKDRYGKDCWTKGDSSKLDESVSVINENRHYRIRQ